MDTKSQIFLLNRLLANYFVLYMKFHRYLWYVKGEQALSLLSWFETELRTCKQQIDELVELILVLEGRPFATMEKFIKEATLEEATADDETEEIMQQIINDSNQLLNDINELIEKETPEKNKRITQYKLSSLEYELLRINEECHRLFK